VNQQVLRAETQGARQTDQGQPEYNEENRQSRCVLGQTNVFCWP
jgi:hypothetical protein